MTERGFEGLLVVFLEKFLYATRMFRLLLVAVVLVTSTGENPLYALDGHSHGRSA